MPFVANETPRVAASDEERSISATPRPLSTGEDPSSPSEPAVVPEETIGGPTTVWTRASRWVPQGLLPYVGPRTPDDQKDRGIGLPLDGRGWRGQPFSIGTFAGVTDGGALVPGHVNQQPSFYGGLNLGWDYDHYFGIEKRLGFGALNLTNGSHELIPGTGATVTGEYRLMWYPLGDARCAPVSDGRSRLERFLFQRRSGAWHLDTVGMIPFGLGLKYLCNERIAVRMDLIDEMTFGDGTLSNFHYVALAVGLELRYGHRLLNMPWHRKTTEGD